MTEKRLAHERSFFLRWAVAPKVGKFRKQFHERLKRQGVPRASLRTEGVIPLGLTDLWRLLALHMDEDTARAIHPWILSGRLLHDEGQTFHEGISLPSTHVVDREIRVAGRAFRDTWTYDIAPPERFTYEIRSPDGLVSTVRNAYRDEGPNTRVFTEADLDFGRIPRFLQRIAGGRLLDRADTEDLDYIRRYGFRSLGETSAAKTW